MRWAETAPRGHRRGEGPCRRRSAAVPRPSSITDVRVGTWDADDPAGPKGDIAPMRDLAAATVLVIVIAVGALAPALWQPRFEGQALASTAVSPTASPMPP